MNKINIHWFRRDLRLTDNAALYHALKHANKVLPLFIFDTTILNKLPAKDDARVSFIYDKIKELSIELKKKGAAILVEHGDPLTIWKQLIGKYKIDQVFINTDYEPQARDRDNAIYKFLKQHDIILKGFKDQVIFEKEEVVKGDGKPYTVFTPYYKQWLNKLNDFYLKSYPSEKLLSGLLKHDPFRFPSLEKLGFKPSSLYIPGENFRDCLKGYEQFRDYPAMNATTRIGVHLRFGTVSIREAARQAMKAKAAKWLSELAWRDFYMMILFHFPHSATSSFKPAYDNIRWRNNEEEFEAWCNGNTGYPMVDAGMRQLNSTGFMHNRVRMVVASFLTKHLLTDWKWGEAYFAEKLLDYEMASNVGGWQWASSSGNDAA
ncbi:MAG: deoxyribodipyrimidine photo-lyase, partial [Sphingobacteriales bacterium]